jgi:Rrf2 family protein
MISTKGRYALRVMIDLAEHGREAAVPLKDVAQRQEISKKYLEILVKTMVGGGLIVGVGGKGGGYRLTRDPSLDTVGEILRPTAGDMAPVACPSCGAGECVRGA